MGLPRVDVVFRFWQCDKENHGWREGRAADRRCQVFDLVTGLHPPGKVSSGTKKEYRVLSVRSQPSLFTTLAGKLRQSGRDTDISGPAFTSGFPTNIHYS
jgi:hypothetical protein